MQILHAVLQNANLKQGAAIILADAAAVAAPLIGYTRAPVDTRGLVANGEDGGGRVEVGHLGGQQLANGVEDKTAHAEQVYPVTPLQDAGNLLHLVTLNVNTAQNGKRTEFILTGALQLMLRAQHGLVLEEHAPRSNGTRKVVDIWTAQPITAVGGTGFLAVGAKSPQSATQSHFHVNQGAPLSLIHLCGPQSTVEMHPQIHVDVQQTCGPVCGPVPFLVAEAAFALVPGQPVRSKGDAQAFHQLRHLSAALLL